MAKQQDQHSQQQANTGRLSNTSAIPEDISAHPGVERPIADPAHEVAQDDLDANPATGEGGKDRARIVPPPNQGDAAPVVEKVGGEAGDTVY